jgi:NhaP-type Na+/H+ or K+/H+ antiporter
MFFNKELKAGEGGGTDPSDIILFMFFGLLMGVITLQVLSRLGDPLPYTVVMFFLGIVFSFNTDFHGSTGMWGDSIYKWSRIDADMMLYIFLPPLIFGEAMNLNWFFVQNAFLQSCLLAGPGVVLTTVFMGVICRVILPYHWSWYLCFTFGAVVSASDTVAVLSIMKESGASPKLTMLIVGESLLNDGTAIVLFALFFDLLMGKHYTPGEIILFFLNCCLGSPLFGVACGLLMVRWLRTVNRSLKEVDTIIQICITICCAYLIFFIAQSPLEISGALACCGAGAMLAWLAPPLILNHESMHNIWSIIEWMGNTLIFLLAGLIIGTRTFEHIYWRDWGYMLLLYVVVMAVRFAVVFILYPLLSRIGYRCNVREAVFMSWGCLRGALAMALALIVEKAGNTDEPADQASRFFFYIGGIATLTLLVNGTTSSKLLGWLGLMGEHSVEKDIIMTQMRKRLTRKMNKIITDIQGEMTDLGSENVEVIRQSVTLLRDSDINRGQRPNIPATVDEDAQSLSAHDEMLADIAAAHRMIEEEGSNNGDSGDFVAEYSRPKGRGRAHTMHHHPNSRPVNDPHSPSKATEANTNANANAFPSHTISIASSSSSSSHGKRARASSFNVGALLGNKDATKDVESPKSPHVHSYQPHPQLDTSPRNRAHSVSSKRWDSRHHSLARLKHLSHGRPVNGAMMPEVLSFVRTIFLEIVRVNYWHDIESGKVPRLSFSARFLLYSIDVGLDVVSKPHMCLQDWACIEYELDRTPFLIRRLTAIERLLPLDSYITRVLARLEGRREKRMVYMLTSFIDAHTTAQKKMHSYVGLDEDGNNLKEGDDNDSFLPEELKVKNESIALVEIAKRRLNAINNDTITSIRVKQVSQMVLAKEAALVKGMLNEGLLSTKDAEEVCMYCNSGIAVGNVSFLILHSFWMKLVTMLRRLSEIVIDSIGESIFKLQLMFLVEFKCSFTQGK